jgi:signal transduction histidine kinase
MMNRFGKRLGLRGRLLLLTLPVVNLALVVVYFLATATARQSLIDLSKSNLDAAAGSLAGGIGQVIRNAYGDAVMAARLDVVAGSLESHDPKNAVWLADALVKSRRRYAAIVITDVAGTVVGANRQGRDGKPLASLIGQKTTTWLEGLARGKTSPGETAAEATLLPLSRPDFLAAVLAPHEQVLGFSAPVMDVVNDRIGNVLVFVSSLYLGDMLDHFVAGPVTGVDSLAVIADSAGRVVVLPSRLANAQNWSPANLPVVALEDRRDPLWQGPGQAPFHFMHSEIATEGSAVGWHAVLMKTVATLEAPVSHMSNRLLLAFAVNVVVSSLILLFLAGHFVRPIRRLTVAVSRTEDFSPIPVVSSDEVGVLTSAYNRMLAHVKDLIGNIEAMSRREREILAQANATLEQRVKERTEELSLTNSRLQQEMDERTQIEIQLRHAQKLESIGRLAAGVAHEINTPIQFVGDNVTFLKQTFADLLALDQVQRTLIGKAASLEESDLAELREAEENADVEYLREQVPRAIASTQDGIARVAKIVQSMKSFAYPDQGQKTTADINTALSNTITVASNELKYVADVETDFGDLPPVPCFLGDINQVALNLLVNAAHAVADVVNKVGGKGKICVRTRHEGDEVVVSISDSGTGIPEKIRERIFDPFFTTKGVGKGTGQGLALAHSVVVKKHGGSLSFETETGKGTTFHVRLPLHGEAVSEKSR